MRKIGVLLGRVLLWTFAVIGFWYLVFVEVVKPVIRSVALDEVRVLEVIERPDGKEAAAVYFHNHQDSSGKYVAVKFVRPPFPKVGDSIDPNDDVVRVAGDATDWKDPKPIRIQWWKKSPLSLPSLDVCPPLPALVRFDRGLFGDATTDVTLCQTSPR